MHASADRPSPGDWYDHEVKPAVFERLDAVFPELCLTRTASGWKVTRAGADAAAGLFGIGTRDGWKRVVCLEAGSGGFVTPDRGRVSWLEAAGFAGHAGEFVEGVRELAGRAGLDPSVLDRDEAPEQRQRREQRRRTGTLLEAFLDHARGALQGPVGEAARAYLADERGIAPEALEDLGLGVFTTPEAVRGALLDAGYSEDEVEALGLLEDRRWAGRVVMPGRDARGHLMTLAARSLEAVPAGEKYLKLAGHTQPVAWWLDRALAGRPGELVVVEGLLDPPELAARGMANVIGLGGALSLLNRERWEELLGFGVRRFVLATDAEDSGREGLAKALVALRALPEPPEVLVVDPDGYDGEKDPGDFVRRDGLDAFQALVREAVPAAAWQARTLTEGITPGSPERERRGAVEAALDLEAGLRGSMAALDREAVRETLRTATGYSPEALEEVAEAVRERTVREHQRRVAESAMASAQRRLRAGEDAAEVMADLVEDAASASAGAEPEPPVFSVARLDRESASIPEGRQSGWEALDETGVWFNPGELAVVGGRTGHAKTTVLVGLLANWLAADADDLLVLYSHEEPEVRVYHRLIALLTAGDSEAYRGAWTTGEVLRHLRHGARARDDTVPGDPELLGRAKAWLAEREHRLVVVHRPHWTARHIGQHARRLAKSRRLGGVFVDYLQRLPADESGKNVRRDQEVSAAGRALKALSIDAGCPVVAGAQINREAIPTGYSKDLADLAEKDDYAKAIRTIRTARPHLHNIREGGGEQEADLVLGLLNYAADYPRGLADSVAMTRIDIGPLKNRYGPPGRWVSLGLAGRFGRLEEADPGTLELSEATAGSASPPASVAPSPWEQGR